MESRNRHEITCEFCGKTRTFTSIFEDGVDWMGHGRGTCESWDDDKGCDCELGKIAFKKTTITPMCLNCLYYKSGCCTNKKELSEVSEMFDCGDKLEIKKPTKKCKYHDINADLFLQLLS